MVRVVGVIVMPDVDENSQRAATRLCDSWSRTGVLRKYSVRTRNQWIAST